MDFKIHSEYVPKGDQPQAIKSIEKGINAGSKYQTLLGVTGSGKTFTMANIIKDLKKPTLVLAHNKTLAAQLCSEFKEFFPESAVEYFVSYYDYYQPEAYVPASDTFIEKDSSINEEIDKLRHSATSSLLERRDVIVVASVSCIYGLGSPIEYKNLVLSLRPGMDRDRDSVIKKLIEIQYKRNDISFERGNFRVRGDVLEVFPAASTENGIRIEFFGDEVERIREINVITGKIIAERDHISIYPATHYATTKDNIEKAIITIKEELIIQLAKFEEEGKLIEAQRLRERTNYDIEMLREMGFCSGIENYSRHINQLNPGQAPYTLIDYFPDDFLLMIDESHVSLPQVRAMYNGDKARKTTLVNYGFRLPSALDNRPLKFEEFENKINQAVFVSATPGPYEKEHSENIAEQIIRPTGLLDPVIEVRPVGNQVDDLIKEIRIAVKKNTRVLVTTLTKKYSEDLTHHLKTLDIKVRYLHSDIVTMERVEILRDLRLGKFDVLIGINLLREGLDLPEVTLVAILDADKEGFLRSETSMVQTIGRASRNSEGKVIMYADRITGSMDRAIKETNRRREIQNEYNIEHNIEPQTIRKDIRNVIEASRVAEDEEDYTDGYGMRKIKRNKKNKKLLTSDIANMSVEDQIIEFENRMFKAANDLKFEKAAELRDEINMLKKSIMEKK